MASSKASVKERFTKLLEAIQTTAETIAKSYRQQQQPTWLSLDQNGWDGDLFDMTGLHEPFDRAEIAQDAKDAVKDGEDPGVVGDLTLTCLQGEFLAAAERAYRLRHQSAARSRIYASARQSGHGNQLGIPLAGIGGYADRVEHMCKETVN